MSEETPAPGPRPVRHGRLPRRGAASTATRLAASALAVLLASTGIVGAFVIGDLLLGFGQGGASLANETVLDDVPDIGAMEGGLNFLLIGSDARPADGSFGDPEEDSGVLNDVNMLLHISQDHSHVEVVAFPRDMIVPVPECVDPDDPDGELLSAMSGVKINTVLSYGGMPCVVQTVEQLTGLVIPVAGVVGFQGVASMSEAVGGVEVCLVDPIVDPEAELDLPAGVQSISGRDALGYLRTRKAIGDGSDLGRIANQQAFLSSLLRTLQSDGTLGDPVKLYSIAKVVTDNVELSNRLQDPATLISIALTLKDVDLSQVVFMQYPTYYTDDFGAVMPDEFLGPQLNLALQEDRPVQLNHAALDESSFGTVAQPGADPGADAGEPAPPADGDAEAEAGEPVGEGEGGEAPPPDGGAAPIDGVIGQSADEVRCAAANGG